MKKAFIYFGVIIAMISLVQCKRNFLDRTPPGVATAEGFYTTEDALVAGITGIYQTFQGDWWGGAFIHLQPHMEGATENDRVCCDWEYGVKAIGNGTVNPNTGGFVQWKWNYGYQAITRINQILSVIDARSIPGLSDANAKKWAAEVRFLRAFVYSQLIFYYGDVPLITKPITPNEAKDLARTPKAQVLAQIIEDLDYAIANLSNTPNNGQFGRPTSYLASAIKGKVYLYEKDWVKAADAFRTVIALEGDKVLLDPNYESLFRGKNEQSKEVLFSIQYVGQGQGAQGQGEGSFIQTHYAPVNVGDGNGAGWQSLLHTFRQRDAFYCIDGKPITTSPLYRVDSPFQRRDPRMGWTFLIPGYYKLANGDSLPYSTFRGAPVLPRNIENQGAQVNTYPGAGGFGTKKWVTEIDNTSFSSEFSQDLILVRYADILLMYAEAQNEGVGPDASVYAAVNKVRRRALMPDFAPGLSQSGMRDEIRHERNVEFAMEGMRYNDLIRWRIAETVIPSIPILESRVFDPAKNYLWPIPQSAIDANPKIKQNPGYN